MRSLIFAILASVALSAPAEAQQRCRVMDPTGTPLNVRETPSGQVVGQLPNGRLVRRAETVTDSRGRGWTFIHDFRTGDPIGWVFREFIACF
jgi:hypothetical protein